MSPDILYKIGVNIPEEFLEEMMDSSTSNVL